MHEQKCNNNELIGIKGNCKSMNEVFLIGKIITEIKFDFVLNSKKKSIAQFYLKTLDKEKIKIAGYDDIADFCYIRLNLDDNLFLYGFLRKTK